MLAAAPVRAEEIRPCAVPVLTLAEAATLLRIDPGDLAALAEQNEIPGRRIGTVWRFSCQALLGWLDDDNSPAAAVGTTPATDPAAAANAGDLLSGEELADIAATGIGQDAVQPSAGPEPAPADGGDEETIGEAPEEPTAEDIFLRGQRVLLGRRQAVIDFGQFYTELNGQPLASVDGNPTLTTLEQETLLTSFQARVGLSNETELFVGTAYFTQENQAFINNQKIASADESDVGNVTLGARHTFMREGPGRPDVIGSLGARIPTDDGSYALNGGLAFVKSVDPVVLFANVAYTHVFTRDPLDVLHLEPEDRLDVALGYALALNDTLALSMSVSGTFTAAQRFDDIALRQRDSYALRFGLTSWLARGVYIEPSVSFNLGGPNDGFAFGITVPYTLGRR